MFRNINDIYPASNIINSSGMKSGKGGDESGLQNISITPLSLLRRLTLLFNQMLIHSFVPRDYRFGIIIHIVKDSQGSHGDVGS